MASITSMIDGGTSSLSSIYGSRNVLSGLASGMDTESMIENAVSGIKTKIQRLQQKRTKVEWQQEAYRSIIDKAVNFNNKYMSYSSKTNLLSNSFFTNAVNTAAMGTYKDKVTATGKTSSDIKLNAVKQLATAASYSVSGLGGAFNGAISAVTGGEKFDIKGDIPVSTVSGSLTFQYGGTNGATFDIKFDELEDLNEVKVFDENGTEVENPGETAKLAQAIRNKLSEVTYTYTKNGFQESTTADKAIKVKTEMGRIYFEDGLGNGNSVKISSSSGEIEKYAGENVLVSPGELTKDTPTHAYLSGKELGITFNGTTKKISMDDVIRNTDVDGEDANKSFMDSLQKELDKAFGAGKITAGMADGKLSLTPSGKGDMLSVGGSAVKALGFESGDSNYINTGKKLTDILGDRAENIFTIDNRMKAVLDEGTEPTEKTSPNGTKYYLDKAGNRVEKGEDGNYYRVDNDGKALYDFQVNDAHIAVTEDTTLESLINSVNSNAEAGMKVSYSKLTNEFKFTATETGANSRVEFGGLAKDLFGDPAISNQEITRTTTLSDVLGSDFKAGKFTVKVGGEKISINRDEKSNIEGTVYWLNQEIGKNDTLKAQGVKASYDYDQNRFIFTKDGKEMDVEYGEGMARDFAAAAQKKAYVKGQDAVMDVEINGVRFDNLTRSSNTFDIDGMNITVKGEFTTGVDKDGKPEEAVTFQTTTDTDKIVEAVRSFVNDYNEMITELKGAYSTQPAYNSKNARYEPLTAEQEEEYSESELAAYNEKAKQGILFGDSTLSSMYSKLLSAITPGGTDGQTLREIGIGTSYSDGLTTISLDEDKLRTALENDPDKVRNAFTKTQEGGSASNGLMQTMQNTLNSYVKTTGEPKGVLITRAGSIKAPTSLNSNSLKSQIDSINNQIERWQDKMSDQIDRYTTQFTRLEQLIAEMNSQSSALSGLMGGYSG